MYNINYWIKLSLIDIIISFFIVGVFIYSILGTDILTNILNIDTVYKTCNGPVINTLQVLIYYQIFFISFSI